MLPFGIADTPYSNGVSMDNVNLLADLPGDTSRCHDRKGNRRTCERRLGKAVVTVFRDCDRMRTGLPVRLENISVAGVHIVSPVPLNNGEQIKIRLQNVVQRFVKEFRGVVRWQTPRPDQSFGLGIELQGRMTPLDLAMLKRAGIDDLPEGGKVWI